MSSFLYFVNLEGSLREQSGCFVGVVCGRTRDAGPLPVLMGCLPRLAVGRHEPLVHMGAGCGVWPGATPKHEKIAMKSSWAFGGTFRLVQARITLSLIRMGRGAV